jgi:hypothetical protein
MVDAGLGLNSMITPTLATVNIISNASSLVGVGLALSGVGLYFLRSVRPNLARDHDIFFAAVALVCGGILFFNGWRQDPILQFGQFMLTGSAIFFAVESIRLRAVATEQAKRTTPVVDDDRPVSRVYRAELDELDALDEEPRPITRRIRGTRDSRPTDEYGEEARRRPSSRSSSDRLGSGDAYGDSSSSRPRRRPPSSGTERPVSRRPDVDEYWGDTEDKPVRSSRPSRSSDSPPSSRPRRTRPPQDAPRRSRAESERSPSDYVDYQPIDYTSEDQDNPRDYD